MVEDSTLFGLMHSEESIVLYWIVGVQSGVSSSVTYFHLCLLFFLHFFRLLSVCCVVLCVSLCYCVRVCVVSVRFSVSVSLPSCILSSFISFLSSVV